MEYVEEQAVNKSGECMHVCDGVWPTTFDTKSFYRVQAVNKYRLSLQSDIHVRIIIIIYMHVDAQVVSLIP